MFGEQDGCGLDNGRDLRQTCRMARVPNTARTRRGVSTRKILAPNQPNLNLLESREPESCGGKTPRSIIQRLFKATTGQGAHSATDYRRRSRRVLLLSSSILRSSRSAGGRCVRRARRWAFRSSRRVGPTSTHPRPFAGTPTSPIWPSGRSAGWGAGAATSRSNTRSETRVKPMPLTSLSPTSGSTRGPRSGFAPLVSSRPRRET